MQGTMEKWYEDVENFVSPPEFESEEETLTENTGEWFEFIWSTTRAIRKDITQQDLNRDPIAVDLIEKCARFHIMCSERLIEEERYLLFLILFCDLHYPILFIFSHNFDKKLNDENLTKCIQTLKHMYYDISIEGQNCPNEAEFRAYDILMKINDGGMLSSYKSLICIYF